MLQVPAGSQPYEISFEFKKIENSNIASPLSPHATIPKLVPGLTNIEVICIIVIIVLIKVIFHKKCDQNFHLLQNARMV